MQMAPVVGRGKKKTTKNKTLVTWLGSLSLEQFREKDPPPQNSLYPGLPCPRAPPSVNGRHERAHSLPFLPAANNGLIWVPGKEGLPSNCV